MFGGAVVGKKALNELGSRMNETAASGMSSFAKRLMEKQGWSEGKGLGKNEDGMTNYVKVKQREGNAGLGIEEHERKKVSESWWFSSFDQALQSFKKLGEMNDNDDDKKKRKKKKKKEERMRRERQEAGDDDEPAAPTYEDLFRATGGKRMGMRARASQKGKWERTEAQGTMLLVKQQEQGAELHKISIMSSEEVVETSTAVVSGESSPRSTDGEDDDDGQEEEEEEEEEENRCERKQHKKDKKKRKRSQQQEEEVVVEVEQVPEAAEVAEVDGEEEDERKRLKRERKKARKEELLLKEHQNKRRRGERRRRSLGRSRRGWRPLLQ